MNTNEISDIKEAILKVLEIDPKNLYYQKLMQRTLNCVDLEQLKLIIKLERRLFRGLEGLVGSYIYLFLYNIKGNFSSRRAPVSYEPPNLDKGVFYIDI